MRQVHGMESGLMQAIGPPLTDVVSWPWLAMLLPRVRVLSYTCLLLPPPVTPCPAPCPPDVRVFVNMEMAEKVYSKKGEHMCPNDGWVCFRNSELISGRLGKVGPGWPSTLDSGRGRREQRPVLMPAPASSHVPTHSPPFPPAFPNTIP